MGLTFKLSKEEKAYTRDFFIAVYTQNAKKIFELISSFSSLSSENKKRIKEDIEEYCKNLNTQNITNYFINMVNICLKYNVAPPEFLYKMAKAFVCLNGINFLIDNDTSAIELLKKETLEYLITKNINDSLEFTIKNLNIAPHLLKSVVKHGLIKTLKEDTIIPRKELLQIKQNLETLIDLIKITIEKDSELHR